MKPGSGQREGRDWISDRSPGFTLIELVLSTALMTLVLAAAYGCLQAAMATRRTLEPRSDRFQAARVSLALLTADLRSAVALHKGPEFLGATRQVGSLTAGNLDFATHHFTPRQPGEGDYACVSWYVEVDPATGEAVLWRRRNPGLAPDPLTGGAREEIVRPVVGFDLEFYDGYEWFGNWGDPNGRAKQESSFRDRPNLVGMPKAVRITLTLPGETTADAGGGSTNAAAIPMQTIVKLAIDASGGTGSPSGSTNPAASGTGRQSRPGQP